MRLKLNLILQEGSQMFQILGDSKYKKIIYPVNIHANYTVRDLKRNLSKFLTNLFKCDVEVENLLLHEFLLLDEFETNSILNNDDEVSVYYKSEFGKTQINLEEVHRDSMSQVEGEKYNISKKKMKTLNLDLNKEEDFVETIKPLLSKENKKDQVEEKKIKTKNKNNITNKNVTVFESGAEDSSSDSESKYVSIKLLKKKINRNNTVQKEITQNNKPLFANKKIKYESFESSSEEIPVKKQKRISKEIPNDEKIKISENMSKVFNTIEEKIEPPSNIINSYSKNNKYILREEKISTKEESFDLINSYMLENMEYLKKHFPTLFEKGTSIIFRIYEMSMEYGGPAPSGYKKGKIEQFIEETKYFIIKLEERDENLTSVYSYDEEDGQILSVHLKDLIELRVEKSVRNNPETEIRIEPTNSQVENHIEKDILVVQDSNTNKPFEPRLPVIEKPKQNVFTKILYSQLKKQIEYYFSDKNYYKDQFLLEKASLNEERCNYLFFNFKDIDLEHFMGFNKIKTLTNRKGDIVEALKESNVAEFNECKDMIRKKNIVCEFVS